MTAPDFDAEARRLAPDVYCEEDHTEPGPGCANCFLRERIARALESAYRAGKDDAMKDHECHCCGSECYDT